MMSQEITDGMKYRLRKAIESTVSHLTQTRKRGEPTLECVCDMNDRGKITVYGTKSLREAKKRGRTICADVSYWRSNEKIDYVVFNGCSTERIGASLRETVHNFGHSEDVRVKLPIQDGYRLEY